MLLNLTCGIKAGYAAFIVYIKILKLMLGLEPNIHIHVKKYL